ncbi:hypothetical protein Tco_1477763 [Tanacetum coccineum]
MADKGKKSSIETFTPNDKADYYSGITSITVNGNNAYELKGKFLDDLHSNAFNGTNRKDAVENIKYYLKIIDPIKLPIVNHDKLRIVVFPISLAGGARRWFDRTKESITCWVDLTAKFFGKYYPPSCIEGNNTLVIKWDPANPRFEGWLATKFVNHKPMDIFTKGALWDYWKMGGDEIEITKTIGSTNGTRMYDGCMTSHVLIMEYGRNRNQKFPGAYHIGNSLHYQDLEWYEALEDRELKDEALRNKAIIEGLISDDESSNDCWKRWKSHEICYHDYDEGEYENETHEEEHELCGIKTREVSVCQIKRYKMIKYSFNNEEEYAAVKEDEYDDLTITSEEACRAYQEIFLMMDEDWIVTRTEREAKEKSNLKTSL